MPQDADEVREETAGVFAKVGLFGLRAGLSMAQIVLLISNSVAVFFFKTNSESSQN